MKSRSFMPTMVKNELFRRSRHNPIITAEDMPYLCSVVFNPGATKVGDQTLLLLRVEDLEGKSHLTVARSHDGVTGWRIEEEPLISPSHDAGSYEEFGCEDPRITYLYEINRWIIAYTAYSSFGAGVALATTANFQSVERFGLVLAPINKDAAVFPRMINGYYWMLHRPAAGDMEHIWLTKSEDLIHWGGPWCILMERGGPMWDSHKVGANTIPIETEEGWLILYHGVKMMAGAPTYRMGLALLDLEDPRILISRLPYWVLGPNAPYETAGAVPNVVFPCGHTQNGDEILVYYGAADCSICVASASISEMLDALQKYRV